MRSTAPSLRRRNYARRRSLRQPLSRRDDSDSDDGLASGEDTGPDSDSDDDEPLFRPSRPAAGVGRANPAVGGVPAARLGAGSGSPSSRVVQPVVRPVTRPAAQPPVQSVTRPIVQATSRPVAQPVVRPGAQPVVRPGAQPVVRPAAQPVVQPVAEPVAPPVVLQPAAPPSPTPSPVLPGVTLGADEGGVDEADDSVSDGISSGIDSGSDSESDVETTTPGAPPPATPLPTGITPVLGAPPDVALPPPAATTSPGASPVLAPADPSATPAGQLTGSPSQTTGALTSSNAALTPLPSLDLTSTLAIPPGRTGVGDALAENETAGNTLGPIATEEQPVNAGMAAGIVIGVLGMPVPPFAKSLVLTFDSFDWSHCWRRLLLEEVEAQRRRTTTFASLPPNIQAGQRPGYGLQRQHDGEGYHSDLATTLVRIKENQLGDDGPADAGDLQNREWYV